MVCPREGEIVAFVRGSRSGAHAVHLEAHLADCRDCRQLAFALATECADDARRDAGPVRIGRFEVLEVLGDGAMGRVYRALDPELGRHVAIKVRHTGGVLDADADERLRREAQALARLSHPNVVAVHETGRHADTSYVVMEYVDGVTLDRWVATPRKPRDVIDRMVEVARGLAAAHAVGLVHRDVKPQNILLPATGAAKIGDFGLARLDVASRSELPASGATLDLAMALSLTGSLAGTPVYMAPEQLRGELATERSDQFSFCVTLFEALIGSRPFSRAPESGGAPPERALAASTGRAGSGTSGGIRALLAAIERGSLELPAALPARVRAALARGLDADPARRFASMADLIAVLAPRSTRTRWLALGAAAGALVAVAAAYAVAADPAASCAARDPIAARAFGPERRFAIRARLAGQHAEVEGRTADRALDEYGRRWEAARARACRASDRPARFGDRQRGCLDRALRRADDLGLVLMAPMRGAVNEAARAVEALPDPEPCVRGELVERGVAALVPVVAALDLRVDRALNLERAGRAGHVSLEADGTIAAARALRHAPLLARALLAQAALDAAAERFTAIEPLLDEAARVASAASEDELVAEAWTRRIYLAAVELGRVDEARRWVAVSDAAILRAGDPPRLRALLHVSRGVLFNEQGAFAEARRELEAALAIHERARPRATLEIAQVHTDIALVLMRAGQRPEARVHLEAALGLLRSEHGDLHPRVIKTLNDLGALLTDTDLRAALAYLEEARRLGEQLLGADSELVAMSLNNLAIAWNRQGDLPAAVAAYRQANESYRRRFGSTHPRVAITLANIAGTLNELGDVAAAVAAYRESEAILVTTLGSRDTTLARVQEGLGNALLAADDAPGALAAYRASVTSHGEVAMSEDAAIARVKLGELLVMTGGVRDARHQFDLAARALAALPVLGADARFYPLRARAGLVYCDAMQGQLDRRRLVAIDREAAAPELPAEVTGFVSYARARGYAALGDHGKARALAEASRADFGKAEQPTYRAAVARWLRAQR